MPLSPNCKTGPESIGASTVVFDNLPLPAAIRRLAEIGITTVEPALIEGFSSFGEEDLTLSAAKTLRREADLSGVHLSSVSLHCDLGADTGLEKLTRRVNFAAEIGAKILVCNSSQIERRDRFRSTVEAIIPLLERADLVLALENPGHGLTSMTGTAADLVEVAGSFSSDRVQYNFDPCNAYTFSGGGCDADELVTGLEKPASLHVKDVVQVDADWRYCPVGAGSIDYTSMFKGREITCPVIVELPVSFHRPSRSAPERRYDPPSDTERGEIVLQSIAWLAERLQSPERR